MNRIRLVFVLFCVFLGLVIYAADVGVGDRYWGWLEHLPMGDKVGHCGLMFTLSLLANLSLRCRVVRTIPPTILLGTVLVTFVVLAEEFSQIWIPGRDFDVLDIAADLVGIGCGDLLARSIYHMMAARKVAHADCSA